MRRGGSTNNFGTHDRSGVVTTAISYLSHVIVQRRQEIYEPAINSRAEYKNMLVLGHYRNKIVHLFFKEGIFACALYALVEKQQSAADNAAPAPASSSSSSSSAAADAAAAASNSALRGISRTALLTEARFLFNLLQREVITSSEMPDRIDSDKVSSNTHGHAHSHSVFLCFLLLPPPLSFGHDDPFPV